MKLLINITKPANVFRFGLNFEVAISPMMKDKKRSRYVGFTIAFYNHNLHIGVEGYC